jgi:hypothetical protein
MIVADKVANVESGVSGEKQEEKKDETREDRKRKEGEAVKFVGKSCSIS